MNKSWSEKDYLAKCDEVERLELEAVAATVRMDNDSAEIVRLQAENTSIRELMNCYNLGGWTDSLTLIKERDAYQKAADEMAAAHKVERDGLRAAAQEVLNECLARDFNEHWDSYTQLQAAMKGTS